MALVCPSVCLSVMLVIHTSTVEHIKMPFAQYNGAMLNARFLCSSWASCMLLFRTKYCDVFCIDFFQAVKRIRGRTFHDPVVCWIQAGKFLPQTWKNAKLPLMGHQPADKVASILERTIQHSITGYATLCFLLKQSCSEQW